MTIMRAGNNVELQHGGAAMQLTIEVAAKLLRMAESEVRELRNFTPYAVPKGGRYVYPVGSHLGQ